MDCRTALEELEVARIGAREIDEPELHEAGAHIEGCLECESLFHRRQRLDAEIAAAMQQVHVPANLKQRLLSALLAAEAASGTSVETHGQTPAGPGELPPVAAGRRRRWIQMAVAVALCLSAGLAGWTLWRESNAQASVDQLRQGVTWDVAGLPEFDGPFSAPLPGGWERHSLLRINRPARRIDVGDGGGQRAAVHRFVFESRRRPATEGLLVIAPRSLVSDPPADTPFSYVEVVYTTGPAGQLASAAWGEGELVYVCIIRGGAGRLEELQRAMQPRLG